MLLMVASFALADPGRLLPGAESESAGTLELRGGVSSVLVLENARGSWGGAGPQVLVDWAPTDRFDLEAQAPLVFTGSSGSPGVYLVGVPTLGARFLVVDQPKVRLAPSLFVGAAASPGRQTTTGRGSSGPLVRGSLGGAVGLALEAGGPRATYDLNLTGFAALYEPGGSFTPLPPSEGAVLLSDIGVRFTPSGPHSVRLGLTGMLPTVTWMYQQDSLLLDVTLASAGFVTVLGAHAGWAF